MPINQISPKWQKDAFGVTQQTENFSANFIAGRSVVVGFNGYFGGHTWASGGNFSSVVIGGVTASLLLRQSDTEDVNHILWYVAHNVGGSRSDVVINIAGGSPSNYYTGAGFECDDLINTTADSTGITTPQSASTTPSVSLTTVAAAVRVVAGFSDRTGSNFVSITPNGGLTEIWGDFSGNLHMSGAGAYKDELTPGAKTYTWSIGAAMDYIAGAVGLKTTGMSSGNSGIGVDFIGDTNNPRATSAFDTSSGGVVIAAVGRGVLTDFDTTNVTDNQGNGNYTQLGVKHAYTNWTSSGTAVYAKTSAAGGTGHVVQTTKPSSTDEVTILALHVNGVDHIADVQWVEDLTSPNTSASVTLSGAGVLVAVWAGDDSSGELNPGIEAGWTKHQWTSSLASNHVQMAIASRVVPLGGTYTVTWTPTTSQGAQLWLIALDVSGVAQQVLVPDADITDGAWTPSTGADLFAAAASATDYITTSSNSECEIGLENGTTPDSGTQTFHYTALGSIAKALVAGIYDGTTLVEEWTVDPLTIAAVPYARTLTTPLSSLADPRVRFETINATAPPTLQAVFGAIGTGANGSTTVAPSYPTGITAGQYLTCQVSSGATNSETPSTPSGWTLLATGASTDGTYGVDAGPRRMTVFGKVATGSESGTLTVSITNGGTCRGTIIRWTAPEGYTWDVVGAGANDSTSGTGVSMTTAAINWATGDAAMVAVGQRVDTATQSAQSLTASGTTFGTRTNRANTAVTTGNDHRHVVDTFAAVTTGGGSAATTWAYTASAAVSAGGVIVRLRVVPPTEFARVNDVDLTTPGTSGGGSTVTSTVSINTAIQAPRSTSFSLALAIQQARTAAASVNTAIAVHNTATNSIQIALQQAKTATASLNTAIRQGRTASIVQDLAIQVARSATHLIDLAVQQNRTATVSINTAIQRALNAVASIDTVIQQHLSLSTQISLMVQAVTSATFSIDLQIQVPSTLSVSINTAILQAKTATPQIDTGVQVSRNSTAAIDSAIRIANNLNISVNTGILISRNSTASVQTVVQQARAATANLEAAIRAGRSSTANIEAAILAAKTATALLNTAVQQRNTDSITVDTAIQRAINALASVDTVIALSQTLTTQISLLVQAATNASFSINMQIQIPNSVSAALNLAILQYKSAAIPFDVAIQLAKTAQASINTAVSQNRSALTSINVPIRASHTLQTSIDTAAQISRNAQTAINAAVALLRTASVNLNMQIQAGFTRSSLIDLAISQALSAITSLSTAIQVSHQASTVLDLVVALHNQVIFDIDMLVQARRSVLASVSIYVDDGSTIVPSPERTFTAVQGDRTTARDSQGRFVKAAYGRTYIKPSR